MQETSEFMNGVIGILYEIQQTNPEIGHYQRHYKNEKPFLVELTNGTIGISREAARDFEIQPQSVSDYDIKNYAATFRKKPGQ